MRARAGRGRLRSVDNCWITRSWIARVKRWRWRNHSAWHEGEERMAVKPGWEGRYFEDFTVGDIYRCRQGRTVTEASNSWFTLLTNNTNQIHFNNEYAK